MTSGLIFDIKRYAINDGPGIRTAVFMKGCPLKCWWCHNPEGQSGKPQLMFRHNRCKASKACLEACPRGAISWIDISVTDWDACDQCGKCVEVCFSGARELVGREVNIERLMEEIGRDVPFYDQSGGGVTFTGGEPLRQTRFLQEALLACREQDIHTIVDTSGHTSWAYLLSILPFVSLFLYDLKHMDDVKHITYTGVSNQKILDNLQKLSYKGAAIIVRIPLIPGVNDDQENLKRCATYLSSLPHLEGIELMPYHEIGLAKYQALGMQYKMANTNPPSNESITEIEDFLTSYDLRVIRHPTGRIL